MSARQNKAVGAWSSQKKEVDKHFVSFFEGVERDIAQVRHAPLQQHVLRGLQQVLLLKVRMFLVVFVNISGGQGDSRQRLRGSRDTQECRHCQGILVAYFTGTRQR